MDFCQSNSHMYIVCPENIQFLDLPMVFNTLFDKGETSEPDAFAKPCFTLKYGSQKRTKGFRTGQKTAKADGLILKP